MRISKRTAEEPIDEHAARQLARTLLDRHALHDWTFAFDRAVRRFGACHYATKRITLSRTLTLLNDEPTVRDVLLHEIAHALEPGDGHGSRWRRRCVAIGARPERLYDERDVVTNAPRYLLTCPACSARVRRYRQPRRPLACARCCDRHNGGRYTPRFTLAVERLRD